MTQELSSRSMEADTAGRHLSGSSAGRQRQLFPSSILGKAYTKQAGYYGRDKHSIHTLMVYMFLGTTRQRTEPISAES